MKEMRSTEEIQSFEWAKLLFFSLNTCTTLLTMYGHVKNVTINHNLGTSVFECLEVFLQNKFLGQGLLNYLGMYVLCFD